MLTTLGAAAETALEKLILLASGCEILSSIKASIVSFETLCLIAFGKTKIMRMATITPTKAGWMMYFMISNNFLVLCIFLFLKIRFDLSFSKDWIVLDLDYLTI